MSKGWELKDENWNAKSNHVHELTKRRHAGSWVSLIPCRISTDQLWPPAMTPTYWVCHPGASCRYVFTTWGECLRWHKTHQRFLCPLLCLKMKNIGEVRMKTAKISAKRLEWVTESGELFGTELDTHRKARSRPCVTVSAWQKNNSSKITVILAPSAVQLQLFWRPEISCAWPAFCTERVGSQLLKTQSERMSCPCCFFGHLRKCRSRMQRKWITATTGLMVVQRISSYCPSSGGDLLGDLSTMFDDLSGSNWPTAFWSWGGPWRRMIMMTATVLLMGSSMTTCCSRSGRTWSSTSLLFVIICSNLHCVRDCWWPTRYGHSSRNCGWDSYRNCWSSTWCHCQSCCWLRQSFGWPRLLLWMKGAMVSARSRRKWQ